MAWLLTVLVDNPAKDFAYEVDVVSRNQRPPPPKKIKDVELTEEELESYYHCWSFLKRSWKILLMVLWIILVFITTEIYIHTRKEPEKYPNEAHMGIIVTS